MRTTSFHGKKNLLQVISRTTEPNIGLFVLYVFFRLMSMTDTIYDDFEDDKNMAKLILAFAISVL